MVKAQNKDLHGAPSQTQESVAPVAKTKSMMQSPIKHSTENFNPYEHLLAQLKDLPLIHIHAAKTAQPKQDRPRRISQIALQQAIPKGDKQVSVSLPWIFILAMGETAAKLGGADSIVSSRTTTRALLSMVHTGKPPTEHRKTAKSAIGAGTIPEDADTCTTLDANGKVIILEQDSRNMPPPDAKLHFTQLYKPLEQLMADLRRDPPEIKLNNTQEEILKTGIMEVKINSDDSKLSQKIFRINLSNKDFQTPLASDLGRKIEAPRPDWWTNEFETKFGPYEELARNGFPVEYQNAKQGEFKPYRVAAEKDEKGNLYVITGDQDLFTIPRTNKYDLGNLGYERIDTHAEQGVDKLIEKLKAVHNAIVKAGIKNSGETDIKKIAAQIDDSRQQFAETLLASKPFLSDLGAVTPYAAYFILEANQRVVELTKKLELNPTLFAGEIEEKLKNVDVTSTVGFRNIPISDIDIHPGWMKQDPIETCRRLDEHVRRDYYIGSDIMQLYVDKKWELQEYINPKALFKHMEYIAEAKDAQASTGIEKTLPASSNPYQRRGSSAEEKTNLTNDIFAGLSGNTLPDNWVVHAQTADGEITNLQNSLLTNPKRLLIEITHENDKPSLIQIEGNKIVANESADKGYKHIQEVLETAKINTTEKNQFTPAIFSGTRLEAQQNMEAALNHSTVKNEMAYSNR